MPVVRKIVKKAAQSDYRLSAIVMGIVESAPFQMRTKLEPEVNAGLTPVENVNRPIDTVRVARSNQKE
jgi:hypothetical protein